MENFCAKVYGEEVTIHLLTTVFSAFAPPPQMNDLYHMSRNKKKLSGSEFLFTLGILLRDRWYMKSSFMILCNL